MRTKTDQNGQLRGIVLDVDGTILDPHHRLSPATVAAVGRARAAGLHVLIASGRSPVSLRGVLRALGLAGPAVAFNGAATFRVTDDGIEALADTPVDRDAAVEVLDLARAHEVETGWYTLDSWHVAAPGPGVDEESELTADPPTVTPDLPDGLPAPHKLMCVAITPAQEAALGPLRDALPAGVRGVFSHPRYLEVIAPGVDKARAVADASAALGLELHELAAIGDAENDIAMLRAAGTAIAMGNASDAVKAVADRVTSANDRDGAARAIDDLLGE